MQANERCFINGKKPEKKKTQMRESFYTPKEYQELMHYAKLIGISTASDLKKLESDAAIENKKPLEYIKDFYFNQLGGDEFKLKESINKIESGLNFIGNKGLKKEHIDCADDFNDCVTELKEAFAEFKEKYLR